MSAVTNVLRSVAIARLRTTIEPLSNRRSPARLRTLVSHGVRREFADRDRDAGLFVGKAEPRVEACEIFDEPIAILDDHVAVVHRDRLHRDRRRTAAAGIAPGLDEAPEVPAGVVALKQDRRVVQGHRVDDDTLRDHRQRAVLDDEPVHGHDRLSFVTQRDTLERHAGEQIAAEPRNGELAVEILRGLGDRLLPQPVLNQPVCVTAAPTPAGRGARRTAIAT